MLGAGPHPPVDAFGAPHLLALLTTLLVALGLCLLLRRHESKRVEWGVRGGLSAFLVAMSAAHVVWVIENRGTSVWEFIPLHLCDLSIFVSLYALLAKRRLAAEVLYFWTCSGTFLAMVLPAIERGFPSPRFFIYFSLHGGVVVSSIVAIYGLKLYPDKRSPLRAFAITLLYTAVIAVVDFATGQNYLFLAHKPPTATLLDFMGPWPVYIFVALSIGLGLFFLLGLPFRGREPPERKSG